MPTKFGQIVKSKNGDYKKIILDLKNYINPISNKKELFTREQIGKMSTDEYQKLEEKILMQLNSIGIPTNSDLAFSKNQDYENDPTAQWIWVLDNTKKSHSDFCSELNGQIFENETLAPSIPVHPNCGCQLIRCVMV